MSAPAVLLDRDGTIIVERDYLSDPAGVTLEHNALAGLQRLARAGATLAVVTNQSGVGRGYYDEAAVARVNARVAALLAEGGVTVAGWYVCPHAPDVACDCRKPAPGLARRAAGELGIDLSRAYVVGDKASDLGLARAVGASGVLVRTGYGARAGADAPDLANQGVIVAADLVEAAEHILAHAAIAERTA